MLFKRLVVVLTCRFAWANQSAPASDPEFSADVYVHDEANLAQGLQDSSARSERDAVPLTQRSILESTTFAPVTTQFRNAFGSSLLRPRFNISINSSTLHGSASATGFPLQIASGIVATGASSSPLSLHNRNSTVRPFGTASEESLITNAVTSSSRVASPLPSSGQPLNSMNFTGRIQFVTPLPQPGQKVCGCTVSALAASIAWWYPDSFKYAISTVKSVRDSDHSFIGFSALPAATPFDVSGQLVLSTVVSALASDSTTIVTSSQEFSSNAATVDAAGTQIISVTAVKPLPTGILGLGVVANAWLSSVPQPTLTLSPSTFLPSAGTPYLYIPAYVIYLSAEVEGGSCGPQASQTLTLPNAYYGNYSGSSDLTTARSVQEENLPPDFFALLPTEYSGCKPVLNATVEVIVTVYVIYNLDSTPFEAYVEPISDTNVPLATPTLSVNSAGTTFICQAFFGGGRFCHPVMNIAHIEHPLGAVAPLEGPKPGSRTIKPKTTRTAPDGRHVTVYTEAHGGVENTSGGPDTKTSDQGDSSGSSDSDDASYQPLVAHIESPGPAGVSEITFFADSSVTQAVVSVGGIILTATAKQSVSENNKAGEGTQPKVGAKGDERGPTRSNDPTTATNKIQSNGNGFVISGQTADFANTQAAASEIRTEQVSETSFNGNVAGNPFIVIGSSTVFANAATQFSIGPGQTLTPDGVVTAHGTRISLGPSASFVVFDGHTQRLETPQVTPPVLLINSTRVTAKDGLTFVVGDKTLTPGGAISFHGSSISLGTNAAELVVNGATFTDPRALSTNYPPLTISGTTFAPLSWPNQPELSAYRIGGEMLVPGGPALTFNGAVLSLLPHNKGIVINGATTTFSATTELTAAAPVLTIDGREYTAIPGQSNYIIDGRTLSPGGTLETNGKTITLGKQLSVLVVDGRTTSLFPPAITGMSEISAVTPAGKKIMATRSSSGGVGIRMRTPILGACLWVTCLLAHTFGTI